MNLYECCFCPKMTFISGQPSFCGFNLRPLTMKDLTEPHPCVFRDKMKEMEAEKTV